MGLLNICTHFCKYLWWSQTIMLTEITFTLRKNGGYMPSSLCGRSFPLDRLAKF